MSTNIQERNERISFVADPRVLRFLRRHARENERTTSAEIRLALREYAERVEISEHAHAR